MGGCLDSGQEWVVTGEFGLRPLLFIAELLLYFRKEVCAGMVPPNRKRTGPGGPIMRFFGFVCGYLLRDEFVASIVRRRKGGILQRIATGGVDMSEMAVLHGAEPREILETAIEKQVPIIMSYQSCGKWHGAKLLLTDLGACQLKAHILTSRKRRPINIRAGQPVGLSFKYGYGKFIFESRVISLEPSAEPTSGGTVIFEAPDRIEIVQRRSYFRVEVPRSLKVNVLTWHRRGGNRGREGVGGPELGANDQEPAGSYWQGRLVDISAGGAQIAIEASAAGSFRNGQFVGVRFTPMPYEMPLVFNAQVRSVLPTVDNKSVCLGLQIVGLEASDEGRQVLQRLCGVVEHYYKMNQSGVKQQDFQGITSAPQGV